MVVFVKYYVEVIIVTLHCYITYPLYFFFLQLVSQSILKYCLRGMLGAAQRQTLFAFVDVTTKLLQEHQDPTQLAKLEEDMNFVLALLERDFPASIQV